MQSDSVITCFLEGGTPGVTGTNIVTLASFMAATCSTFDFRSTTTHDVEQCISDDLPNSLYFHWGADADGNTQPY